VDYFKNTINPKYPSDRRYVHTSYPNRIIYGIPSNHVGYVRLSIVPRFDTTIQFVNGYNPAIK